MKRPSHGVERLPVLAGIGAGLFLAGACWASISSGHGPDPSGAPADLPAAGLATTFVHGLLTILLIRLDNNRALMDWRLADSFRPVPFMSITLLMALAAATVEIGIWAATHLPQGALPGWEAAVNFSSVTYAGLGYGDITLSEPWRLLGSFEVLVGGLMTGWSTALLVYSGQLMLMGRRASPTSGSRVGSDRS